MAKQPKKELLDTILEDNKKNNRLTYENTDLDKTNYTNDKAQKTADTYIKLAGTKDLKRSIVINANDLININGEIDNFKLLDNVVMSSPLYQFENNEGKPYYENKDKKYWDKAITNYIIYLKRKNDEDISNVSYDDLKKLIVEFNTEFLNKYIAGIKPNAVDLIDESTTQADHLTRALVELQTTEIYNIGYDTFLYSDLDKLNFNKYIGIDLLKGLQEQILAVDNFNELTKEDKTDVISNLLHTLQFLRSLEQVENQIKINQEYYTKLHNKHEEINSLIKQVAEKYKARQEEIEQELKRKPVVYNQDNADLIEEMQNQSKDIDKTKITTSLLSNKVFNGNELVIGEGYEISYNSKANETIQTTITLFKPNTTSITLNKIHKSINDAVGSLLDAGVRVITTTQLYNFINKGSLSNDYVDRDKIEDLLINLNQMDTKADIDATQQFNLAGYKDYIKEYEKKTGRKARPRLEQDLLNYKIMRDVPLKNGELTDIIMFLDYPAVYDYAKQYRQLATYPAEILDLNYSPKSSKNTLQITDITRTIRNELIRCIELRRSGINQPIVINNFLCNECQFYDVIDKDTIDKNNIHTKVINKQKRVRYTNNIETILNNFKDKGYIKGYKINKNGKVNKYSIQIIFS